MAISLDLRKRIHAAWLTGKHTRMEIAGRYNVSLGMVKKLIQQHKEVGHVANLYERVGRPRALSPADEARLEKLIGKDPGMTLMELRAAMGARCCLQTIHVAARRLGKTYKKRA